jgi:2-haloacid dehalogenase
VTAGLVAFDVNETLLDVSVLRPVLSGLVGGAFSVDEWFTRTLHGSLTANHLGRYRPFAEIALDSLLWLAERQGLELSSEDASGFVMGLAHLPPHPDVAGALESLAARGYRMVALTNGSAEVAHTQIVGAGIAPHLERVLSASSVERFKPAPEVYLYAAAICDVDIDDVLMVAAHDWDVAGAQSVGAKGCFVRRQPWGLRDVVPSMTVDDLTELAAILVGESDTTPPG